MGETIIDPYRVPGTQGNMLESLQMFARNRDLMEQTRQDRQLQDATRQYLSQQYGLPMGIDPMQAQEFGSKQFALDTQKKDQQGKEQFVQNFIPQAQQRFANDQDPYMQTILNSGGNMVTADLLSKALTSRFNTDQDIRGYQGKAKNEISSALGVAQVNNQSKMALSQAEQAVKDKAVQNYRDTGDASHLWSAGITVSDLQLMNDQDRRGKQQAASATASQQQAEIARLKAEREAKNTTPVPESNAYTFSPEQNAQLAAIDFGTSDPAQLVNKAIRTGDRKAYQAAMSIVPPDQFAQLADEVRKQIGVEMKGNRPNQKLQEQKAQQMKQEEAFRKQLDKRTTFSGGGNPYSRPY